MYVIYTWRYMDSDCTHQNQFSDDAPLHWWEQLYNVICGFCGIFVKPEKIT